MELPTAFQGALGQVTASLSFPCGNWGQWCRSADGMRKAECNLVCQELLNTPDMDGAHQLQKEGKKVFTDCLKDAWKRGCGCWKIP